MATLVHDRLTPMALEDAITAFADGWSSALGWDPRARQLAVFVAHTILECGAGYKSLHWWNFGNVKASPNYPGPYCMYRCNEVLDGKTTWFDPPHPQTWFRAYGSAADGAKDHVRFFAVDTNGDGKNVYGAAWNMVLAGDAEGFVRAMKAARYFTGNVEDYVNAVVSIAHRIGPACDKVLAGEHHGITPFDEDHVEALVAMFLTAERDRLAAEPFPLPPGEKNS